MIIITLLFILDATFQFILNGLQHKDLAQMAAFALSKFCTQCFQNMSKMFPVLLEVFPSVFFLLYFYFEINKSKITIRL